MNHFSDHYSIMHYSTLFNYIIQHNPSKALWGKDFDISIIYKKLRHSQQSQQSQQSYQVVYIKLYLLNTSIIKNWSIQIYK